MLALIFLGCGDGLPDKDFGCECEIYDDMYSHSVLFCGGRGLDNVADVFQVCNHRDHADDQLDGCVSNFDLMVINDGCEVQHVCLGEK